MEQAGQGAARCDKIDSMLRQLEQERAEAAEKETALKTALDKENFDVEKLEGKGLAAALYTFLGNIDRHLQKERGEAIAAKLKYDQAVRDRQDIDRRIGELRSEREAYAGCRREYEGLYEQKKQLLLREAGEAAHRILDLTEKIRRAQIDRKEIREAAGAGEKALNGIAGVRSSLDSAEGWGTWDLLGGGLVSDLAKHSHIDEAKAGAEETQEYLRGFRTELADVQMDSRLQIEIGGFAKFADFFFDGLIADWYMQSKIHEAQRSVEDVGQKVREILEKLDEMQKADDENEEEWGAELRELVERA